MPIFRENLSQPSHPERGPSRVCRQAGPGWATQRAQSQTQPPNFQKFLPPSGEGERRRGGVIRGGISGAGETTLAWKLMRKGPLG